MPFFMLGIKLESLEIYLIKRIQKSLIQIMNKALCYLNDKNYFLVVSAAAVVSAAVVSTGAITEVAVVSTTVESAEPSVLEVQAAREATPATNKIANTFFIFI